MPLRCQPASRSWTPVPAHCARRPPITQKILSATRSPNHLDGVQPGYYGPFITRVMGVGSEGVPCVVTSRRHRKRLQPLLLIDAEQLIHEALPRKIWSRIWAPRELSWWLAFSFIIGSALFTLGAALALYPSFLTPWWHLPLVNNLVYVLGSVFFTIGGYLQWLQSVNANLDQVLDSSGSGSVRWRWFGFHPRNLGYLASLVQLVGTILFNFDTSDALFHSLSSTEENLVIWSPDLAGSICFLLSSGLIYMEATHRIGYFKFTDLTLWIAMVNLMGSILFQISACADYFLSNGTLWWTYGCNGGTFLGGVCFLIASYLLIPELSEESAGVEAAASSAT